MTSSSYAESTAVKSAGTSVGVLLTGPELTPFRGGIQSFSRSLLSAFDSIHTVTINYFPVTHGLHNRESWWAKVRRLLSTWRPFVSRLRSCDVVHLNSTFDNRSVARDLVYALIARAAGRQTIFMFHGGNPCRVWLFRAPLLRAVPAAILGRCSWVLVLSSVQLDQLRGVLPSLKNLRRISNFVEVGPRIARGQQLSGDTQFLFLGRLHVDKGVRELIEAAQQLALEGRRFCLRICGAGAEEGWILEQIESRNLARHVQFCGVVSGKNKEDILRIADVLVLPSYDEAFPFVVLEAFSAGIPIIATPVGAMSEVVSAAECGLLVSPKNVGELVEAMKTLIADQKTRLRMGQCARRLAETQYSHESMRALFCEIYGAAVCEPMSLPELSHSGTDGERYQ